MCNNAKFNFQGKSYSSGMAGDIRIRNSAWMKRAPSSLLATGKSNQEFVYILQNRFFACKLWSLIKTQRNKWWWKFPFLGEKIWHFFFKEKWEFLPSFFFTCSFWRFDVLDISQWLRDDVMEKQTLISSLE